MAPLKLVRPKLSLRMKTFVEKALEGKPFWDVCCDHGYVGIEAMHTGRFSHVHFVDQVPHIMQRLEKLIKQSPSYKADFAYTLHCLSAEKLQTEIEGTFLIAGVGGLTIKNILSAQLLGGRFFPERLLLSPHTDEAVLVSYLDEIKEIYGPKEKMMVVDGKRERPLYLLEKI